MDKNKNPPAVVAISMVFQLKPPVRINAKAPIGIIKKGSRKERQRYPADESTFFHKIKEMTMESIRKTPTGITKM